MFWFIYIVSSCFVSHLIAGIAKRKYLEIFLILTVILITPAQIEVSSPNYAPSIFIFFYNLVFQEDISVRVLRPLFLSLPLTLIVLFVYLATKKRFF